MPILVEFPLSYSKLDVYKLFLETTELPTVLIQVISEYHYPNVYWVELYTAHLMNKDGHLCARDNAMTSAKGGEIYWYATCNLGTFEAYLI